MRDYEPSAHAETTAVAPLLQFFELVHIGDTIQSMVQVYFDKELVCLFSLPHPSFLLMVQGCRHRTSTGRTS